MCPAIRCSRRSCGWLDDAIRPPTCRLRYPLGSAETAIEALTPSLVERTLGENGSLVSGSLRARLRDRKRPYARTSDGNAGTLKANTTATSTAVRRAALLRSVNSATTPDTAIIICCACCVLNEFVQTIVNARMPVAAPKV